MDQKVGTLAYRSTYSTLTTWHVSKGTTFLLFCATLTVLMGSA